MQQSRALRAGHINDILPLLEKLPARAEYVCREGKSHLAAEMLAAVAARASVLLQSTRKSPRPRRWFAQFSPDAELYGPLADALDAPPLFGRLAPARQLVRIAHLFEQAYLLEPAHSDARAWYVQSCLHYFQAAAFCCHKEEWLQAKSLYRRMAVLSVHFNKTDWQFFVSQSLVAQSRVQIKNGQSTKAAKNLASAAFLAESLHLHNFAAQWYVQASEQLSDPVQASIYAAMAAQVYLRMSERARSTGQPVPEVVYPLDWASALLMKYHFPQGLEILLFEYDFLKNAKALNPSALHSMPNHLAWVRSEIDAYLKENIFSN